MTEEVNLRGQQMPYPRPWTIILDRSQWTTLTFPEGSFMLGFATTSPTVMGWDWSQPERTADALP